MREAIAFVADVPEDSFDIDVQPVLPAKYTEEQTRAQQARETATAANAEAARRSRAAVRAGLPLRDIGTIMGISHQRAAQLVND